MKKERGEKRRKKVRKERKENKKRKEGTERRKSKEWREFCFSLLSVFFLRNRYDSRKLIVKITKNHKKSKAKKKWMYFIP